MSNILRHQSDFLCKHNLKFSEDYYSHLGKAPCSVVELDRRFRGTYCLHNQGSVVPNKLLNL